MNRQEIHELAQQVCIDRLNRGVVIGHTKSGRCIVDTPAEGMTPAERKFFAMQAVARAHRPEVVHRNG